ncbi:MAG: serine hydrolase [Verrucomicrobiales bacterium]|nr:serine hydrolase [Verrucomicrobiales bacterium]
MKMRLLVGVVMIGFVVPSGAAELDAGVLEELSAAMAKQVEEAWVSGVIGLIAKDGEVGYYETFGKRVIEGEVAMGKDTLMRIFSMTKPIVAVTAMALWEEGKFKLDDPISKFLPEWENPTVREGAEVVAAKSPVTVRQLMTHSSGLSYARRGLELSEGATLEEFSKSAAERPLEFQPGTNYRYGYSIDILGRLIEAIAGKPLDVVMRERVFDRTGMDDTEFWVREEKDRGRVAVVYGRGQGKKLVPFMKVDGVMKKPSRMMGGQGLISTTGDYAKFCEMFLNRGELGGKRVLKAATVELMCENHLEAIGKVYGLGGMVDGNGLYFWGGAAGTKFWVNKTNESYGLFMIQRWGYEPPTWGMFEGLAKRALAGEKAD